MTWAWRLLFGAALLLIPAGIAAAATNPYKTIYYDHSGTACADKPGTNHLSAFSMTGLAFNGTDLMFSCWGDNTITLINPHTGGQDGGYTIVDGSGTPLAGIGALAWDAPDNVLWACNLSAYALKYKSKAKDVGSITLDPSTMTGVFTHVLTAKGGCDNGVAYDPYGGSGPSLWTASVSTTIYNYSLAGALFGQQPVAALLGGWGGGMAFTADTIYIADPQTKTKAVYRLPRDFSGSTLILSGSHRFEDMECDATTFAPNTVIWVEWFNQNAAKPIHVSGSC